MFSLYRSYFTCQFHPEIQHDMRSYDHKRIPSEKTMKGNFGIRMLVEMLKSREDPSKIQKAKHIPLRSPNTNLIVNQLQATTNANPPLPRRKKNEYSEQEQGMRTANPMFAAL
mmetsp:Transcript_6728/g.8481  ORF Transcript_6728/g.8481 Transcript_6728/m.8481 type:complete len:113 (-) Transcript_6728:547-885(-)